MDRAEKKEFYTTRLNETYNTEAYGSYLKMAKEDNFTVLRNIQGKHMLEDKDLSYINEAFGGIFKDIFKS